jgi:putative NADH-flavin reductase
MTKLAIIGASKGCGLETLKDALSRGWSVSALARNPEQAGIKDAGLAWYKGDARNELLLEQALKGCDAVAVTLGAPVGSERISLFSDAVTNIMTVMNRQGVKRLVFLSGIGAGDSRGSGGFFFEKIVYPFVLARNFEDKNRAEALIMKSHKDWTILRPGKLTNRKRKGQVLALAKTSDYRNGSISRADVGQYICECVKNNLNIHETPVLIS